MTDVIGDNDLRRRARRMQPPLRTGARVLFVLMTVFDASAANADATFRAILSINGDRPSSPDAARSWPICNLANS